MNVSLKQLRVFITICQKQSMTKAASELFISKAAVSMALAELESQLGKKLFDRHNNRLHLNQEGERLLPLADELINRATNIEGLFTQSSQLRGTLSIGASETIGNQICPWLIAEFSQHTQHTQQQLTIKNSAQICEMLLNYQLDIALIEGDITHPAITTIPWITDEMCVISAPQDDLLEYANSTTNHNLPLSVLDNRHWILREEGSGSRAFFNSHIAPALGQWHSAYQLSAIEAQLNFVAAGLGLACVSKFSAIHALENKRVCILPLAPLPSRQYKLIILKDKFRSELVNSFITFCQNWQPHL